MAQLLAGAGEGQGGAIVIEGAAGIGKSSLLAAARETAAGLLVVSARGGELERAYPFGTARQLLEPVLARAGDDERRALLTGAAALAERVLAAPGDDAAAEFAALHGLYWLAVNLAERQPVLAIVDDAQWADRASLRWLVYLARRLEGVPIALLVAARTAPDELLDELLATAD